jgi:hypothetical protein
VTEGTSNFKPDTELSCSFSSYLKDLGVYIYRYRGMARPDTIQTPTPPRRILQGVCETPPSLEYQCHEGQRGNSYNAEFSISWFCPLVAWSGTCLAMLQYLRQAGHRGLISSEGLEAARVLNSLSPCIIWLYETSLFIFISRSMRLLLAHHGTRCPRGEPVDLRIGY